MKKQNLLSKLPLAGETELVNTLVENSVIKVERIVSNGQCSPDGFWYDQGVNEWVMVLAGEAGLEFEGETEIVKMTVGDAINIPAHCRHRVAWTASDQPTVWLAVHY